MNDQLTNQLTEEQWLKWLDGESCPEAEALLADNPELESFKEGDHKLRSLLSANLPASQEPPYADFLNSRIEKEIRDSERTSQPAQAELKESTSSFWQGLRWLVAPLAAAACFVLGLMMGGPGAGDSASSNAFVAASPMIYTPDGNVSSRVVEASEESTVIILDGLSDIPDSVDLFQTALHYRPANDSYFVNTALETEETSAH